MLQSPTVQCWLVLVSMRSALAHSLSTRRNMLKEIGGEIAAIEEASLAQFVTPMAHGAAHSVNISSSAIADSVNGSNSATPDSSTKALQETMKFAAEFLEKKLVKVQAYEEALKDSIQGTIQLSYFRFSTFGIAANATLHTSSAFWKDTVHVMRNVSRIALRNLKQNLHRNVSVIFLPPHTAIKNLLASVQECRGDVAVLAEFRPYNLASLEERALGDTPVAPTPKAVAPPAVPETIDAVENIQSCVETTLLSRTGAAIHASTTALRRLTQLVAASLSSADADHKSNVTTKLAAPGKRLDEVFFGAQDSFARISVAFDARAHELTAFALRRSGPFGVGLAVALLFLETEFR